MGEAGVSAEAAGKEADDEASESPAADANSGVTAPASAQPSGAAGARALGDAIAEKDLQLNGAEISQLYEHLSQEYARKVGEIVLSRGPGASVNMDADPGEMSETDDEEEAETEAKAEEEAKAEADADAEAGAGTEADVETANDEVGVQMNDDCVGNLPELKSRSRAEETEPTKKRTPSKVYSGGDVNRKLMELVIRQQPQILKMNLKVPAKALLLLGDSELDEKTRKHITSSMKITPKVLGRLGEAFIAPEKARQRLGSMEMTTGQRKAMMRSDEKEEEQRDVAREEEKRKVLDAKPSEEAGIFKVTVNTRVNSKAITQLGGCEDESLMKNVRSQVTGDMTLNRKTMHLTGDSTLAPKKAADRRGSEMHPDQIAAMLKNRDAEAVERKARQHDSLVKVLETGPTEEQLAKPAEAKVTAKALQKMGGAVEIMPRKATKVLGDEMTPKQRKKMNEGEKRTMSQKFAPKKA